MTRGRATSAQLKLGEVAELQSPSLLPSPLQVTEKECGAGARWGWGAGCFRPLAFEWSLQGK